MEAAATSPVVSAADLAEAWLTEAYALLESGWCQNAPARNEAGVPVSPESPFARAWSATGALTRLWRSSDSVDDVLRLDALGRANLALTAAMNEIPAVYNDAAGRRKEHVLEAVLAAVTLVRGFPIANASVPPPR